MKTKKNTATKPETVSTKPETVKAVRPAKVKAEKPAKVKAVKPVKAEVIVTKTLTAAEFAAYRTDTDCIQYDDVPKANVPHIKQLFNLVATAWPKRKPIPAQLVFTAEYTSGAKRKLIISDAITGVKATITGRPKNLYDFIDFDIGPDADRNLTSWSKVIRPMVTAVIGRFEPKVAEVAVETPVDAVETATAEDNAETSM